MSGGKRRAQKGDARGGRFFLLPHCVLNSEAFRTASPRAIKVLMALCAKHDGFNNGRICLGFRELAQWTECQNHAAHNEALGELVARGLAAVECEHPKAKRLSTEYRLTFLPTEDRAATNEYLTWKRGDAGTKRKRNKGNFVVAVTATGLAETVATTATGEETSRCEDHNGGHVKLPFSSSPPVAITATHIGNHTGGSSGSRSASLPNTRSIAPDPNDLRQRIQAVLADAERGSQGQLAAMAAIRPAALSKFLSNSGSLSDQARIRLTCALPKVAARNPERATA